MAQKNQRCKVLRAFYHRGDIQGKGTVLTLPMDSALEFRSAGKLEFVQVDVKTVHNPAPQEPTLASQPGSDAQADADPKGKGGK